MLLTESPAGVKRRNAALIRNVAPGVHRLHHAYVNCYLIEEAGEITIVDAALPATWPLLGQALSAIGSSPAQVKALVLTHAHFDHLGFALRIRDEWSVPIWAHPHEAYIARHPYRYAHERPRAIYPIEHPRAVPILGSMARAGAFTVRGIDDLNYYAPGQVLDVPGHPRVVFSPGHTFGHCALHLPDRDALITGDALVTLDPYTGWRGPQIVSAAATADTLQALASLEALAETGARIALPGHGEPWKHGIAGAVGRARAYGAS
ncbi:MAG TPA: MBL fold metallo-hydrolase [Naasia sp.]|jgi:glyoxylase-like metal-dependent hydrolase (beta-lactamase superfamily II)